MSFSKRIFRLSVQTIQLILLIHLIVINAWNISPCGCPPFCCSKVLYRMERKICKISNLTCHLSISTCPETVCAICKNNYTTYSLLNSGSKIISFFSSKQTFFLFYNFKYLIVVSYNSTQINSNYCLGFIGNSLSNFLIIHFWGIFLAIHKNHLCTTMNRSRCCCRVCISWNNNFISLTNTTNAEIQFFSSSCRIQANNSRSMTKFCQPSL